MSDDKIIKEQRDRYVGFTFATGDLFIEVSEQGKILDVSGAPVSMTGIDQKSLIGRNWLDLFSAYELARLQKAKDDNIPGRRIGPALVSLNEQMGQKIAVFSAIRMPANNRLYIVLGVSNEFITKIAPLVGLPGATGFTDNFGDAARDAIFDAKLWGQDVAMTFFEFGKYGDIEKYSPPDWGKTQTLIGEAMAQYSFGGYSAGQIAEGKYSFVHDKNVNIEELKQKIIDIAAANGITGSEVQAKTVESDLKALDKTEISRALDYTIDQFEAQGAAIKVNNLQKGYKDYLATNDAKLKEFKTIIERVSFTQFFQPVVAVKNRELHHYELLSRFERGEAQEWIRFGEDAGLAPDFDLAVLERAVNHIKFKAGGTRTKFSMNISTQSIASEKFRDKLKETLAANKGMNERLQFDITESANIEDLARAGSFIKELQKSGFKVALDDFGPSASAAHYLQNLKPDYIKVDGMYVRRITSPREQALLRNLTQLCASFNVEVIAEKVEEKAQADLLAEIGIKYAQGDFYAPAGPKPDYIAKT